MIRRRSEMLRLMRQAAEELIRDFDWGVLPGNPIMKIAGLPGAWAEDPEPHVRSADDAIRWFNVAIAKACFEENGCPTCQQ